MKTYRVPKQINAILNAWGLLGYDTLNEAANGIVLNEDWLYKYDTSDFSISDVEEVQSWRNDTLKELQFA